MAKKASTDDVTKRLIAEVARRKAAISLAERPQWRTNASFSFNEGRSNESINLHVESNVRVLVMIVAFLMGRERDYREAADSLGVDAPAFSWSGFFMADWVADVKMRIDKIQIGESRKTLEALEARLNAVMSPEMRAQLELEAIEAELG